VSDPAVYQRSLGLNVNWWWGLALVTFGVVMLAFGLRGNLFRSNDGGQSWQPVASGATAMLTDGFVRADGTLVLVGLSGTVLTSKDRGLTWTLHQQADRKGISAALPVAGDDMVTVGEAGVNRITAAGK